MRKDIEIPKVKGVELAIVKEEEVGHDSWKVYLMNKNQFDIDNVLVSSKGYGTIDGENRQTSILRHLIGKVDSQDYALIEPIDPEVFTLSNEYWVSYRANGKVYDKKYVFVEGAIKEENLIEIKMLGKKGVLHN